MPENISGAEAARKQTVTIFDWDDTLLASSFLAAKGFNRLDQAVHRAPDVDAQLKELELAVISLLCRATECGRVFIITNAETGWVQLSAQTFLPGVVPYLDKVTISSARSTYEPAFPQSPIQWKFCAFHDQVVNSFADDCPLDAMRNVVSLGDSRVEREAVLTVTRNVPFMRCKSVKFSERPTLEQLRAQLELMTRCFGAICAHDGDLDLQLQLLDDAADPMSLCASPLAHRRLLPLSVDEMDTSDSTCPSPTAGARSLPRVQLTGYQPPVLTLGAAPYAVACGAYSNLIMAANGTALVLPSASSPQVAGSVPAAVALAANVTHSRTPSHSPSSSASAAPAAAVAAAAAAAVAALNGVEAVASATVPTELGGALRATREPAVAAC